MRVVWQLAAKLFKLKDRRRLEINESASRTLRAADRRITDGAATVANCMSKTRFGMSGAPGIERIQCFDSDGSWDDKQTPQRINVKRSILKTPERWRTTGLIFCDERQRIQQGFFCVRGIYCFALHGDDGKSFCSEMTQNYFKKWPERTFVLEELLKNEKNVGGSCTHIHLGHRSKVRGHCDATSIPFLQTSQGQFEAL